MCLLFALLDCLFSKEIYIQHNKECKHRIKGKNEFFFAKSLKFGKIQLGHLHTCPLHYHISYIMSIQENTFDHIFHSQLKKEKMLLNCSDYLIFSQ